MCVYDPHTDYTHTYSKYMYREREAFCASPKKVGVSVLCNVAGVAAAFAFAFAFAVVAAVASAASSVIYPSFFLPYFSSLSNRSLPSFLELRSTTSDYCTRTRVRTPCHTVQYISQTKAAKTKKGQETAFADRPKEVHDSKHINSRD